MVQRNLWIFFNEINDLLACSAILRCIFFEKNERLTGVSEGGFFELTHDFGVKKNPNQRDLPIGTRAPPLPDWIPHLGSKDVPRQIFVLAQVLEAIIDKRAVDLKRVSAQIRGMKARLLEQALHDGR